MKSILSILALAVFSIINVIDINAQANFREGYIINLDKDTVYGLIDHRGDLKNSLLCSFKTSLESEILTYYPGEITAYRFINGKYFISREIEIEGELKMLFLEYILDGIADLYYYRDIIGDHYLIKRDSVELLELTNEVKLIDTKGKGMAHWRTNRHIGLLKASFADCNEIQDELNTAKLNHKSLINITRKYHDYVCDDEICVVYEKELPGIQLSIAPKFEMNISSIKYYNVPFYPDLKFSNSYGPSIGLRVNLLLPRINEKFSLQLESDYSKHYYYAFLQSGNPLYYENHDIKIESDAINYSLCIQYSYPDGKIRPTFSFGASSLLFFNKDNKKISELFHFSTIETQFEEVPLPSNLFGGVGAFGLEFHYKDKIVWFTDIEANFLFRNKSSGSVISTLFGIKTGIYL